MQTRAMAAVGLCAGLAVAGGAAAGPIDDLTGYWTGTGTVVLAGGDKEQVKCAVVYKVSAGGGQIRQSMRCASADYRIDAAAVLRIDGGHVSGNWEERTYSATGEITGRYTGSSLALSIQGAGFTASMSVGLGGCRQSISIAPKGLEVRRVSITLAKC
ncbi:MAG TPA: hypothetical protein VFA64_18445 [Hyphomicrobiaceae bacterium]|nr:hypothetical protein [Hyphomicrobiaceae bacterium]